MITDKYDPDYDEAAAESAARETQRDRRTFWKQVLLKTVTTVEIDVVAWSVEAADDMLEAYDERVKDGRL